MRLYLITLAILMSALANVANAAPILVRSGAHDGFSRLVLDVSPGTSWSVENKVDSARITVADQENGFNLQGVFDRIDRTHVARVASGPNSLDVFFACACVLTAFQQGDRMIVLDVAPTQDTLSALAQDTEQQQTDLSPGRPLQFGNNVGAQAGSGSNVLPVGWQPTFTQTPDVLPDSPLGDIQETSDVERTSLTQAQDSLARQVGAAATRGLLTPSANKVDLPIIQTRPQVDLEIFDSSSADSTHAQLSSTLNGGNLRITSSSDLPGGSNLSVPSTTLGVRCIDPSMTAILSWATDEAFSTQIADLRNELYSEFDRLDKDTAVALARTYLHFGFGMEVREVLALHPKLLADNPALLEMAEIMEYGYTREPEFLHNFMECDTDIALWAILSKRTIPSAASVNTSAALRALTALPIHLRTFIAPELSRRFLKYGEPDAAAAALRSLERAKQSLPSGADMAKADIELATGNVSDAQDRLARVVSSNVEQSAEALIKFVDSHLEADGQIEQDVATLVEAYALQMRDDPIGTELQRTHVLALAKSSQFDAAFEALDRLRDRNPDETDPYVPAAVLNILTKNGNDIEFLDHVFRQISQVGDLVDPGTIVRVADRLVDLGFALEAERVLAARNDIPNEDDARLVRAKVALSLSRPFEAEALIFGLESPEAEILRAEAKAKSGAYDEAHSLFSELGEETGSRQTAWLSDDWVQLIEQDTPVFGDVARVAQSVITDDETPDGMLLRTRDAISESAEARSVIEELLRVSGQSASVDP